MSDYENENENVNEVDGVEILKNESTISVITKAEIDTQIATAKAYPRSIKAFMTRAMSLATINENVAESCAYALPRGDKTLEGPSVRLAEIVVGAYGNIRAGMRIVHNDGKTVTAQGICHDLETNTCVTLEVKRSILQNEWIKDSARPGKFKKSGKMLTMSEDMQVVTGNAACAIAFRNVVFKIVPGALIADIYERVKLVAKGTEATLETRKSNAFEFFRKLGIKDEQIFEVLGVAGYEDIDLDKLAILRGFKTSVTNQESLLQDIFKKKDPTPAESGKAATNATEEALKKAANKATEKK